MEVAKYEEILWGNLDEKIKVEKIFKYEQKPS